MGEEIARLPQGSRTVKAEEHQLLAGRAVTYNGKSAEGDFTAIHAAAKAARIFGIVQVDSADPKATPAPDAHDRELRTRVVRSGSNARVLCSGEVSDGDELETAGEGKLRKVTDGTVVAVATSDGDDSIIDAEIL